jgi:hypothetical protein
VTEPSQPAVAPARLADRVEIANLSASYCMSIDSYVIDDLIGLFSEDCVFDAGPGNGGPQTGNDFGPMAMRQAAFRRTQHQLGQAIIRFTGPDAASGVVYATAWHQRWDMTTLTARLRYIDEYVRRQGRWLIHRRTLEALGVEGGSEDAWNWATRRAPDRG